MTIVNTSIYSVKALVVMDGDGKRVLAKYYKPSPTGQEIVDKKQFEKTLFEKCKKASSNEIMILDGHVVVYRNNIDLFFYIVGSLDENELILAQVLTTFYEIVSTILKTSIDKRSFLDDLDMILLALDEMIDNGIILELDSSVISQRLVKKGGDNVDLPIAFDDESVQRYWDKAKGFAKNLLK